MRWSLAALWILLVLPALAVCAEQTFPYRAWVTSDDVQVRSGPGRDYYPTSKLNTGDPVEVYRHDPGGWYAIRPVEDSFSWVSGRYLDVGRDGLAVVTGDRVASRVGSELGDHRDVIQVRLDRGEIVEILGKATSGSPSNQTVWYKIAPPAGEFRWIFGRYVDPNYHKSGVGKTSPASSPLVTGRAPAAVLKEGAAAGTAQVQTARQSRSPGQSQLSPVADPVAPKEAAWVAGTPTQPTTSRADGEDSSDAAGEVAESFQAEWEAVDARLSAVLAEEARAWRLDELAARAEALLARAETAVERGRARLLVKKLNASRDVHQRLLALDRVQRAGYEQAASGQAVQGSPKQIAGTQAASEARFDGEGWLARVVSSKLGAPRYALVDQEGTVRCYVTPAPGVNLNYYVGQRIGIHGTGGYVREYRSRHVAAKHITPLDDTRTR
jgi:hypothetical protein